MADSDSRAREACLRGLQFYREHKRTGDVRPIQSAITLFQEAVDATPVGHPDRPMYLSNLGIALDSRFERTGQPEDLNQAIRVGQQAVDATPVGHPDRPMHLSNLGTALRTRFDRFDRQADLDQAIAVGQQAVDATPVGDSSRHMYLGNLGMALRARFERTGQRADVDRAIALLAEAVDAVPGDHPDRPTMLSSLGNALQNRFERTGQRDDMDRAVAVGQQAVDAAPVGHRGRPIYLSNLGNALQIRFEHTGRQADTDRAVTVLQQAVDATPADDPRRATMLANLAGALGTRYRHTGQLADLDLAVTVGQQAVDATPANHPDRPAQLSNLGTALRYRFDRSGQLADLDRAITVGQQALDAIPADHPARSLYLSNLANALQDHFELTGRQDDLDQAIARHLEAVNATGVGDLARPGHLSNLGSALHRRFLLAGQLADLDQAAIMFRRAVDASSADDLEHPSYLSNLGIALRSRYRRTRQRTDLDEAITCSQRAVDATPAGHPDEATYLSNLGAALQNRFEQTGELADLDQATSWLARAVAVFPAGHPAGPRYLANLGLAMRSRFRRTGQLADLDEAIKRLTEAVESSPADHPEQPGYLTKLGITLQDRFERTQQQADLNRAIDLFRAGAAIPTAEPRVRLAAAWSWGHCAMRAALADSAVEGYAAAIELLPLVAWHGLDQATREHHLRAWPGLASDAAAAAIAAGRPELAVELLEAGRSMLWTQAARLRADLAALRERASGLATVLEEARAVLDPAPADVIGDVGVIGDADQVQVLRQRTIDEEQRILDARRQAARAWDAAVDQVRRLDGLQNFLRPVPYADLRAAAADGAVVIANISRYGSHALIVPPAAGPNAGTSVLLVALPGAGKDTVTRQAGILLDAQRRVGDPATDRRTQAVDRRAVFEVLAWSWQAIAEPALAALGNAGTPQGSIEEWPRVWWCSTGPAAMLPLHAAGRHLRTAAQPEVGGELAASADAVAGRVISSYTPTLTALTQARARSAPDQVRQLAVGMPEAPGYAAEAGPLPAVSDELQKVARYLPAAEDATQLIGPAATRQQVLRALPSHTWLHMSCHGWQNQADPSLSAFLLHDQRLTLADLAALNLRQTDLAYLAACQTAAGDQRLPDEALHLAGALQLAGYRHVLATLWSISDTVAPELADVIYAHLVHADPAHPHDSDRPRAARAPYALHHAVARLRRAHPGEPLLWAPYIHLGP